MINQLRGWWLLCLLLAVIWTVAVAAYAWINLPRAGQIPHDSGFVSKLSDEAGSILSGRHVLTDSALGSLVWTKVQRVVRMPNGAPVSFPAMTSMEHVTLVRGEYTRLLNSEANARSTPFLLGIAAFWLSTSMMLFVVGWIAGRLYPGRNAAAGEIPGHGIFTSTSKATPSSSLMRQVDTTTGAGITSSGSARPPPEPVGYRFAA